MRLSRFLLAMSLIVALPISASAQTHWVATMLPANEVPPNAELSSGNFDGTLNAAQDAMTFTVTYQNLSSAMLFAHIHRGAVGVNGPIVYFLAASAQPSPFSGATDPAPAGGPTGFNPADVPDLQSGNLYANLHTQNHTGGEIRGQLVSAVPVTPSTWGRMKDLFR